MDDIPEVVFPESEEENKLSKQVSSSKILFKKTNDSFLECHGFLNMIRVHTRNDGSKIYFARVGLLHGTQKDDEGNWNDIIENADLLMGDGLRRLSEKFVDTNVSLKGLKVKFTIKNMRHNLDMYKDKPCIKTQGIIEAMQF